MADVIVEVGHALGPDEAVRRIQDVLATGSNGMDVIEDVTYVQKDGKLLFSGKAKGFKVKGELAVTDRHVKMAVVLPWAAKPFRKAVHATIQDGLKDILA